MELREGEFIKKLRGRDVVTRNSWFFDRTEILWDKHLSGETIFNYGEFGVCCGLSLAYALDKWVIPNGGRAVGLDPYKAPRSHSEELYERNKELMVHNLNQWSPQFATKVMYDNSPWEQEDKESFELHVFTESSELLWSDVNSVTFDDVIPRGYFDLWFVDGAHSGLFAFQDIVAALKLVRVGGIVVVDDFNRTYHRGPRVRDAVRAFEMVCSDRIDYLYATNKQIAFRRVK